MEKSAGIQLELKDLDSNKRTAIIKHSVYNSADLLGDMAHKGMFNRSWNVKTPKFLLDHETKSIAGKTLRNFEDNDAAYTEVRFGNWTLGNDALEMADAGVFTGASFGYVAEKKDFGTSNGKRIRHLREVQHDETSLVRTTPVHPEAGLISVVKAFDALELKSLSDAEQTFLKQLLLNDQSSIESLVALMGSIQPDSDLYTWLGYQLSSRADRMGSIMSQLKWNNEQIKGMKAHVVKIEGWATKAHASDESIITALNGIKNYKQVISDYDEASTQLAIDELASDDEMKSITNFITSLNLETWKQKHLNSSLAN